MKIRRAPQFTSETGVINFVALLVGLALSFISARLAARRPQPPFQDAPTPITSRGARVPVIIGRRSVPAIHAAVGLRTQVGSSGPDYREEAWHILAVGPMRAIHGIFQEGSPINPGLSAKIFPITPATHPSGTLIFISGYGRFFTQWGEETQPVDALLSKLTGIASNWAEIGGLIYRTEISGEGSGKILGPSPFWPTISHDVEVGIQRVGLFKSAPYWERIDQPNTAAAAAAKGFATTPSGGSPYNGNWIYVPPDKGLAFIVGKNVLVTGAQNLQLVSTPGLNGEYKLLVKFPITADDNQDPSYLGWWRLQMIPSQDWDSRTATLTPFETLQHSGANPAHAIYQILFGGWPHGMALRKSKFDLESLEQIGVYFEAHPAPVNVVGHDGLTVEGLMTRIMMDHGIVRTLSRDGRIRFVLMRAPAPADIAVIPADAILAPLPEMQNQQGRVPTTRAMFEFADVERSFTTNVIPIVNDGDAHLVDFPKDVRVTIHTATDFKTASEIAQRKAQEHLSRARGGEVFLGRAARDLANGQVVALTGYAGTWRVLGIGRDALSSRTRVQLVKDIYDVSPAFVVTDPGAGGGGGGGGGGGAEPLQADFAQAAIEVPPWWGSAPGTQRAMLARVRATTIAISSQVYTSATSQGIATPIGSPQSSFAGVRLSAALPAATTPILGYPGHAAGPAAYLVGVGTQAAVDLSADTTAWLTGTQVAIIGGGPQAEVCFLRSLTSTGGGGYTLDGLVRARYDTVQQAWPADTMVYIGPRVELELLTSATFAPGLTRYFKAPAQSATESLTLADADEVAHTFRGANVVPIAVGALRGYPGGLGLNVPAFRVGDTLEFAWHQRRADLTAGYGQEPYGSVHTSPPVVGVMIHRIYADDLGAPAASPVLVVDQGATIGAIFTYAQLFTNAGAPLESLTTHQDRAFWFSVVHQISGVNSPEVFTQMTPV